MIKIIADELLREDSYLSAWVEESKDMKYAIMSVGFESGEQSKIQEIKEVLCV